MTPCPHGLPRCDACETRDSLLERERLDRLDAAWKSEDRATSAEARASAAEAQVRRMEREKAGLEATLATAHACVERLERELREAKYRPTQRRAEG